MIAAGAAIGGLIALTSSRGPSPLRTEGLSTNTTVAGNLQFSNGSLAPIVDEPSTGPRSVLQPVAGTSNSVIAAAVLPGVSTSSTTATTIPGQTTTMVKGATAAAAVTTIPSDNRKPSGAFFAMPSASGSGFGTGSTTNSGPSTGTTTTTVSSVGGGGQPTTTTTAAPQTTTTTAHPTTT